MKTGVLCVLVLACVRAGLSHVMFVNTPEGRRSPRSVLGTEGPEITSSPEMTSLHIESTILYRYAKTSVASKLANKAGVARQITFSAILPHLAFISAFHIEMDGRVYHAYVKGEKEAEALYLQAVIQGLTAAKVDLTIRDSNRFTVSVNVEASAKVTFNLTYEELLTRRLGGYINVINIDPGQIVPDLSVLVHIEDSNSLTSLQVPNLRETNEIYEDDSLENDPLAVIERPARNKATIRWSPSAKQQRELREEGIKGLLKVEYDVERHSNPSQILVCDGYFVHFYSYDYLTPLKKHVVFVLDISGSMHGSKLQQLKEAMQRILSDVREDDFFSIAAFSTTVQVWHPSRGNVEIINFRDDSWLAPELIVPATPDNIRKAKEYVNNLKGFGITNIYDALMTSMEIVKLGRKEFEKFKLNGKTRQMPEPMVIFLTDGKANVRDTETIVKNVTEKNNWKASIFSLGFGRKVNIEFLKKLSLKNSAFSRLIYEASDAALQLADFYRQIASPLLANVTFHYKSNQVENETLTNLHFNALFGGSELIVSGKLAPESEPLRGILTAKSVTGKSRNIFPSPTIIRTPVRRDFTAPSFMEKLWAYLNIQQLLDKHAMEDGRNSTSKERALALALKYSFVTPLTSLIVVKPYKTCLKDAEDSAGFKYSSESHALFPGSGPVVYPVCRVPPVSGGYGGPVGSPDTRGLAGRQGFRNTRGLAGRQGFRNTRGLAGRQEFRNTRGLAGRQGSPGSGGYGGPVGYPGSSGHGEPHVQSKQRYPVVNLQTIGDDSYTIRGDSDVDAQDLSPTASTPTVLTLSGISWTTPESNNGSHVFITRNSRTIAYKIGINRTNTVHGSCDSGSGVPSHCRHLPYCVLPAFATDFSIYVTSFFCEINGFAGVCCPDILSLPTVNKGHTKRG